MKTASDILVDWMEGSNKFTDIHNDDWERLRTILDKELSDAYEKGIRDAAASDCVNHVPACHCAVCEFRNRILALLTKPKDKE